MHARNASSMLMSEVIVITVAFYTVQKATIYQVTTMLATSKHVLFPGHNHLLTNGTDDQTTFWLSPEHQRVKGPQPWWLAGGNDLGIGHFQKWLAWWLPGG